MILINLFGLNNSNNPSSSCLKLNASSESDCKSILTLFDEEIISLDKSESDLMKGRKDH